MLLVLRLWQVSNVKVTTSDREQFSLLVNDRNKNKLMEILMSCKISVALNCRCCSLILPHYILHINKIRDSCFESRPSYYIIKMIAIDHSKGKSLYAVLPLSVSKKLSVITKIRKD